MGWFSTGFGYGLGSAAARVIFGDERVRQAPKGPIRNMTEEQILADEKRFDEEAKRLAAEDAKTNK